MIRPAKKLGAISSLINRPSAILDEPLNKGPHNLAIGAIRLNGPILSRAEPAIKRHGVPAPA